MIVAELLLSEQNDMGALASILTRIRQNLGRQTKELSADTGYCSEANLRELSRRRVRGYVATGRQRHGMSAPRAQLGKTPGTRTHAMRLRLARGGFRRLICTAHNLRKLLPVLAPAAPIVSQ